MCSNSSSTHAILSIVIEKVTRILYLSTSHQWILSERLANVCILLCKVLAGMLTQTVSGCDMK